MTNLRHLRRVPMTEKAVEGDEEKRGVKGEREEEGHCCKLVGRRIDIVVVAVALRESEGFFIDRRRNNINGEERSQQRADTDYRFLMPLI